MEFEGVGLYWCIFLFVLEDIGEGKGKREREKEREREREKGEGESELIRHTLAIIELLIGNQAD